jgi:hypothetical protein
LRRVVPRLVPGSAAPLAILPATVARISMLDRPDVPNSRRFNFVASVPVGEQVIGDLTTFSRKALSERTMALRTITRHARFHGAWAII